MLLMALSGSSARRFDGVELRREAAEKARRNVLRAGLSDRMTVHEQDLRKSERLHGVFIRVLSPTRRISRWAGVFRRIRWRRGLLVRRCCCTLEDLCAAAAYLLKYGGKFSVVYPPERLFAL